MVGTAAHPGNRFMLSGYRVIEPAGRFALSPDGRFWPSSPSIRTVLDVVHVRRWIAGAPSGRCRGRKAARSSILVSDGAFIGFLADNKLKKWP